MKVAVVCLAYICKPDGVDLLAQFFDALNTDLFVHVDSKVDDAAYEGVAAKWTNVRLLRQRLPIFWGGFNTVRAILRGFEFARSVDAYDRYVVITEDTIPVVSRDEFLRRMHSEVEYIDCRNGQTARARYDRFFYFDSFATCPRPCGTVAREITPEILLSLDRLSRLRLRGKAIFSTLYHGSVWCGLTSGFVDQLLTVYHDNAHLRESFEFSAIPEEQYFHTILGPIEGARPLMFTDWSRSPTPYIFKTGDDIEALDTKGLTFLRKVPIGIASIRSFVEKLG